MNNILVVGKPNSGKSLLFNKLTGLKQKVANFPGVTVEIKEGTLDDSIKIIDFPGGYSLNPISQDEKIALEKLNEVALEEKSVGLVCVLDATRLERSLILGLQMLDYATKHKLPIIYALNMMDEIQANKTSIDAKGLSQKLGCRVIPVSGRTKFGLEDLKGQIKRINEDPTHFIPQTSFVSENEVLKTAHCLNRDFGPKTDVLLKKQNFLDRFFLNNILGGLTFVLVMIFLFQAIFTWASPLMDMTESLLISLGGFVGSWIPEGMAKDFFNDAIIGGIGSFIVFVPQIFILSIIIGILEDSGYLARASIICHRPLSFFGLSGKSFIPYLTGHACAIPSIYAARTIESPKKRLLTILTVPLMACSARLPVYSLLITALIPNKTFWGGLIGYRGIAFFMLYFLGLGTALLVSGIISKMYKGQSNDPYIQELPPYRLPSILVLLKKGLDTAYQFFTKAGPIIFVVSMVVWFLGYFPNGSGELESSWLASIGKFIEPIFRPLGVDWKYGVAILMSFLAREVFVGTLGTFFGIEGADENIGGLAEKIVESGLLPASGFALLIFYAIAIQCVSTLAVLKRELENKLFPIYIFLFYTLMAYILAWLTFKIVNTLG
jgi:ferrous iron transport protein B